MEVMPQVLDWSEVLVRLLVTLICAAAIGWERERRRRPAGLRTHMLVALGAATFAILSIEATVLSFGDDERVTLDPFRVLYAVIGGVGFLGAGAVIRAGGDVRGLTTAASIWTVAAIGLASGLGMYFLAGVTTVLALLTLSVLSKVEPESNHRPADRADPE